MRDKARARQGWAFKNAERECLWVGMIDAFILLSGKGKVEGNLVTVALARIVGRTKADTWRQLIWSSTT